MEGVDLQISGNTYTEKSDGIWDNYSYSRLKGVSASETYTITVTNNNDYGVGNCLSLRKNGNLTAEEVALEIDAFEIFAGVPVRARLYYENFYDEPQNVVFTSTDEAVFTVSDETATDCWLNPVALGTAMLIATWGDGEMLSYEVNVVGTTHTLDLDVPHELTLAFGNSVRYEFTNENDTAKQYAFYTSPGNTFSGSFSNMDDWRSVILSRHDVICFTLQPGVTTVIVLHNDHGDVAEAYTGTVCISEMIEAAGAVLDPAALELGRNQYSSIDLYFAEINMWEDAVSWVSSDPKVVEVQYEGSTYCNTYTLNDGTATITVTTQNGLTASCDVTVSTPSVIIQKDQVLPVSMEGKYLAVRFTPESDGLYWLHYADYASVWSGDVSSTSGAEVRWIQYDHYLDSLGMHHSGMLAELTGGTEYSFFVEGYQGASAELYMTEIPRAESFTLEKEEISNYYGITQYAGVEFSPEGSFAFLTVTSDDPEIADMDFLYANGAYIYFKSPGATTLTFSNGAHSETLQVETKGADKVLTLYEEETASCDANGSYAFEFSAPETGRYVLQIGSPEIWTGIGLCQMLVERTLITMYLSEGETVLIVTYNESDRPLENVSVEIGKVHQPESMSLNKTELTLEVGDYTTLECVFNPWNAVEEIVGYTVTTEGVINQNWSGVQGYIEAIAPGTTTLTVTTESGLEARCEITVVPKTYPTVTVELATPTSVVVEDDCVDVLFTPAESGTYMLCFPFDNPSMGLGTVLDPDGEPLEVNYYEDFDIGFHGEYANLEAGKTYTFRVGTYGSYGANLQMEMIQVQVAETVTLNAIELVGYVGTTVELALVLPEGTVASAQFEIEDETIVQCWNNYTTSAELYLVQQGTTTVTVTLNNGATGQCTITVKEPKTISVGDSIPVTLESEAQIAYSFTAPEEGYYIIYMPANSNVVLSE